MLNKIKIFFQESRREFKQINWPTRQQAIRHTMVVVIMSLATAAFLGALDFLFVTIVTKYII